jgi:hypothetical protein
VAQGSNGRQEKTSFCIVDAQSVKNTDSAENKGYDAGKKVSGIKRHIAVDNQGLPHALHVTTAKVTDWAGALSMFSLHQAGLCQVQKVLVDGAYSGEAFAGAMKELVGACVEVVQRHQLHTFAVLPKLGGGAIICLVGKVSQALEKLRKKAQYQPTNGGARFRCTDPQKIVDRF